MKIFYRLFYCVLFAPLSNIFAQNIPHQLTDWERLLLPTYKHTESRGITTPPTSQVRAMAEWEEIDGLVVTWTSYISTIRQIVDYAQEECTVHIVRAFKGSGTFPGIVSLSGR